MKQAMASKGLVLVVFLSFWLFSEFGVEARKIETAKAGSYRVEGGYDSNIPGNNVFPVEKEGFVLDELLVDYSPSKGKPPIHNL
ncbi:hypothetical protein PanWU01x14_207610 [Parasponia andersonii]|uniref:Transmembrane protein n=1 Tax=Parasponia andersonii TaxID=3476 RepID=A0A2P5BV34_PARAD|nr:hypothetical protein PanWU01x14_207610 [Parasponia andersonii]